MTVSKSNTNFKKDKKDCDILIKSEINSIEDIMVVNSYLITKLLENSEDLQVSIVICNLLKLQLKCVEASSLEKRISDIENKMN